MISKCAKRAEHCPPKADLLRFAAPLPSYCRCPLVLRSNLRCAGNLPPCRGATPRSALPGIPAVCREVSAEGQEETAGKDGVRSY